jgi:3-hydroxybutyryl-CoA dehydrogenase
VSTLDEAAKWGLAMRMMVVGVVGRIDFGGLDLTARNLDKSLFSPTPPEYKPKKIFELVNQGHLGVKTGKDSTAIKVERRAKCAVCRERDLKLIKMLKALKTI